MSVFCVQISRTRRILTIRVLRAGVHVSVCVFIRDIRIHIVGVPRHTECEVQILCGQYISLCFCPCGNPRSVHGNLAILSVGPYTVRRSVVVDSPYIERHGTDFVLMDVIHCVYVHELPGGGPVSLPKNPVTVFTSPAICAIILWDTAEPAGFIYQKGHLYK